MSRKGLDGRIVKDVENRDLFIAIAVVAVALVAVLVAVYMLLTALAGSPGPAPTPVPSAVASPGPTLSPTIPSGPMVGGPSGSSYLAPTPVQPVVKSAELVGYGTDKDTYNRGDTATTYILLKNTGTATISEARLDIKVERYVSVIGYVNLQSTTTTLTSLNVRPGETKKAEYAITIPRDYQGVSTAGKYRFTIDVYVWNTKVGNFQKEVEVK